MASKRVGLLSLDDDDELEPERLRRVEAVLIELVFILFRLLLIMILSICFWKNKVPFRRTGFIPLPFRDSVQIPVSQNSSKSRWR